MSRLSLFTLTLGLAATSMCAAGIHAPTEFFGIEVCGDKTRNSVSVHVLDGRLALIESEFSPRSDWKDRSHPRPDRWYILGTKIKASEGGGYLAYDPSGKDHRVYLSREAGKGTDWKIGGKTEGKYGDMCVFALAASGEVKGWCLDAEKCEEEGKGGKTATVYRLVLRKNDERTRVHLGRIYSYRSTAK